MNKPLSGASRIAVLLLCHDPAAIKVYESQAKSWHIQMDVIHSMAEVPAIFQQRLYHALVVDLMTLSRMAPEDRATLLEMPDAVPLIQTRIQAPSGEVRANLLGSGEQIGSVGDYLQQTLSQATPRPIRLQRRISVNRRVELISFLGDKSVRGMAVNFSKSGCFIFLAEETFHLGDMLWCECLEAGGDRRKGKVVRSVAWDDQQLKMMPGIGLQFISSPPHPQEEAPEVKATLLEKQPLDQPPGNDPGEPVVPDQILSEIDRYRAYRERHGQLDGLNPDLHRIQGMERLLIRSGLNFRSADGRILENLFGVFQKKGVDSAKLRDFRKVLSRFYDILILEGVTTTNPLQAVTANDRTLGRIAAGPLADGVLPDLAEILADRSDTMLVGRPDQSREGGDPHLLLLEIKARLNRIQQEIDWLRLRISGQEAVLGINPSPPSEPIPQVIPDHPPPESVGESAGDKTQLEISNNPDQTAREE